MTATNKYYNFVGFRCRVPLMNDFSFTLSLQDLFNEFLLLVLPEAVNHILSEEETTLEMFENVANFTLTSYPDLPILQALRLLTDGLKECSIKVRDITYANHYCDELLRIGTSTIYHMGT